MRAASSAAVLAGGRDRDRRRLVRHAVHARPVDREVPAAVGDEAAVPQLAHELRRPPRASRPLVVAAASDRRGCARSGSRPCRRRGRTGRRQQRALVAAAWATIAGWMRIDRARHARADAELLRRLRRSLRARSRRTGSRPAGRSRGGSGRRSGRRRSRPPPPRRPAVPGRAPSALPTTASSRSRSCRAAFHIRALPASSSVTPESVSPRRARGIVTA